MPSNLGLRYSDHTLVFDSDSDYAGGMKPALCYHCLHQIESQDHDKGWFGDHSKGVYVSKHVDYTFYYSSSREPVPGDEGVVVMFELVTGRVRHFNTRDDGVQPSPG